MDSILPAGVHAIGADRYHADQLRDVPTLSSTLARLVIDRSPLHAWTAHPRLNPDWEPTDSKTFDIGRAAHRAVLGDGGDWVVIPDDLLAANGAASTKAAKEFIADVRARGLTPLKSAEAELIERMAMIAEQALVENRIRLDPLRSELTALARVDGVWCRAMVDNAPEDPDEPLYDFKTTTNASPDACMRAVMAYGYDMQAAHYLATWKAATGEERGFRFIFQEKEPPHGVCVIELGGLTMEMAERKMRRARQVWAECLESGSWPCYPPGVHRVELPEWMAEKWLEREAAELERRGAPPRELVETALQWQAP
ncbi:PD-(D/E)XK nuclease-like domain-containing protein [Oceanicella actignis]|uniref:PD-(D/E)XK nuclease-like domain-containing protein n=1 Tax=Oceanicella actignis TaxID=1189325 RepID=UPI0012574666|nr:PD-(D/E)XK nuclease-like domain-containing protein [Oceanicella actignis]TYO91457.1 PDDEXK-like uncharacterized protein DUF3799 [Oceanicella actignis]